MIKNWVPNEKIQPQIYTAIIVIFSLGTCLFWVLSIPQKNRNLQKITSQTESLQELKRQLAMVENTGKKRSNIIKITNTSQIYDLITESANYSHLSVKSFTTVKKTNNLEIVLVGNYTNLITFFQYLWENEFGLIKSVEIKNNSQDPKLSVELLLTITSPTFKGGSK